MGVFSPTLERLRDLYLDELRDLYIGKLTAIAEGEVNAVENGWARIMQRERYRSEAMHFRAGKNRTDQALLSGYDSSFQCDAITIKTQ